MACSVEDRYRVVVPPQGSSWSGSFVEGNNVVVTLSELIDELRALHQKIHCPVPCTTYCGSHKRQLPPIQLEFIPHHDPIASDLPSLLPIHCTLSLTKHFRSSIGLSTIRYQITAHGYSPTDLGLFLAPILFERVQLSSLLPTSMDWFSQTKVLELHARRQDDDRLSISSHHHDSLEEDLQQDQPLPLFTPPEVNILVATLVSQSCQLILLELVRCSMVPTEQFFDAVGKCPTLLYLNIKDCALSSSSSTSSYVEDKDATGTGTSLFRDVKHSCLEEFTLEESLVDDSALDALCHLLSRAKKLQICIMIQNDLPLEAVAKVATSCMGHEQLSTIRFSGLDTENDSMEAIGRLVESSHCLEQLTLTDAPQEINVIPLANALVQSSLKELDLSNNRLIHMETLAMALCTNQRLQTLNLSKTVLLNISDDDDDDDDDTDTDTDSNLETQDSKERPSFFATLGPIPRLKILNLDFVEFSIDSMKELAQSVSDNTSLERLHLNDLGGSVPFNHLFTALHKNTSLKTLQVGRNRLSTQDVDALVTCLCINRSLTSLTLSGCDLTDNQLLPLVRRLPDMRGLLDLDLSFNAIGKDGATALLQGLQWNYRLRSMVLYNSCWSVGGPTHFECDGFEEENKEIQKVLRRHRCLGWPFRLEEKEVSIIYHILRDEVVLGLSE